MTKGWQREPGRHALAGMGVRTKQSYVGSMPTKMSQDKINYDNKKYGELLLGWDLLEDVLKEYSDESDYYVSIVEEGLLRMGDTRRVEHLRKGIEAISYYYSVEMGAIMDEINDTMNDPMTSQEDFEMLEALRDRMDFASEYMGWTCDCSSEEDSVKLNRIRKYFPSWRQWEK